MKLVKAFGLLVFLFIAAQGSAQDVSSVYSGNSYITNNISNIKSMLVKGGCKDALSDSQVLKLEKIYAAKEPKWNKLVNSGLAKGDMAQEMAKLDAEYADQIEKVLSHEQKQAFRKMSSGKISKL